MKRFELTRPGEGGTTHLSVGPGSLEEAGRAAAAFAAVLLVTDENVAATAWPERVEEACLSAGGPEPSRFMMPAGEDAKSLELAESLCHELVDAGAGRDAVVLAVGGGVLTDLAGFTASVFLRGIPWIAVPTTVLGMADASVGGKTGVNLAEGKNLVGSFWHPVSVHADPVALTTLDDRVYREGWAEVVKAGAIADLALFERLESESEAIAARGIGVVEETISASIAVKVAVVETDAREAGPREILNFGHTLGHAIESATGYETMHGEAVAIGMVAEARHGAALGRFDASLTDRLAACLEGLGLPATPPEGLDEADLLEALAADKKRRAGRVRIALPTGLGSHEAEAPCVEVEPEALVGALFGR